MCRQATPSPHHKSIVLLACYLFLGIISSLFLPARAYAQMDILKELYERAVNAYNNQQYDQAMAYYEKLIKVAPGFAAAYNGMALANQAASGDEGKTIEYLKKAVSYDPHLAQAYDNLGRIYYARQDLHAAQDYFEKALKADPNLASANLSLAWINLLVLSRPQAALKYFAKALPASHDPKIYYGMGSAYFASNQRAAAIDMITKLRELGEEDLASRLEQSMRENSVVNTQADSASANTPAVPAGLGPLEPTSDKPTGIQVHLRGRLSDY